MKKKNEIEWPLYLLGVISVGLISNSLYSENKDYHSLEIFFPKDLDKIKQTSLNRIFEAQKHYIFEKLYNGVHRIGESLVKAALDYPRTWFNPSIGKHDKYHWWPDGKPEEGKLDCNGFLSRVCVKAGIDKEFLFLGPHGFSSSEMYYYIGKKEELLGDVLVLTGGKRRSESVTVDYPGHVAIYCNKSEKEPFIEMSDGIIFANHYPENYYLKRFEYSKLAFYRRKITRNYFMNHLLFYDIIHDLKLSVQDKEDFWTAFKLNNRKFYFDELEWDMSYYKAKGYWVQNKSSKNF